METGLPFAKRTTSDDWKVGNFGIPSLTNGILIFTVFRRSKDAHKGLRDDN